MKSSNEFEIREWHNSNRWNKVRPHRNNGESKENKRESGPIFKCPTHEGYGYRIYWRGDSGWEHRGCGNELNIYRSIDNKIRIM